MVHYPTLCMWRQHFKENLERFVRVYPGQYAVYSGSKEEPTFYKTQREVRGQLENPDGEMGRNSYVEKVPRRMPKSSKIVLIRENLENNLSEKIMVDARDGGL